MTVPESLQETIGRLPPSPGVYLMRGAAGEILYIGKATNLRSRVRSYFSGNDPRPFVRYLDTLLSDVEYVLTSNPKEALLLENTLIKRHRPRFNFMLRDDKNYLAIRIDVGAVWPRVELVRRIAKDRAHYFGPFHSAAKVRQMLNVLNRHFNLRTCTDATLANRVRPCLQYQIRRCPGPCVLEVDADTYKESVRQAELFLSGREAELLERLEQRMLEAAEQLEFEDAARYRDQRSAVEASLERQRAVQTTQVDRDVVGVFREADDVAVAVMQFRGGALNDVATFALADQVLPDDQLVASFVGQFYGVGEREPPAEVLLPWPAPADEDLEGTLTALRGRRCAVLVPQRGEKLRLVELAGENARAFFSDTMSRAAAAARALERLASRLDLREVPRTLECYDISNFQGAAVVASQVAFRDGVPDRQRYRRLKIRTVEGQDDFAAMSEVIGRRVRRALAPDSTDPLPDLIVIDGGKGQLAAAVAALQEAGAPEQPVIALAKSRVTGTDDDDTIVRSSERVFVPGRKNAVPLRENSPEWLLLTRLRDEAHKTAIEFHRKVRGRATQSSQLDAIPGVGPTRRRALLSHFGSIRAIRSASVEELAEAPGFDRRMAAVVHGHLHGVEVDA
ncbi:MAG: excinuclease ABC subunit UvrC [Myxococcales bacterium]|nr:excinuclease ABC subunit UvrC [Myxococcales bacterium]MCB9530947.1 excinuclease ABC subunit UvrC [Myxococcales bacterium]MCB9532866.1 excinuclease ABC subunit UvrC [Myxococcales bacterium]